MEEAISPGLEPDAAALVEHAIAETGHGRQETRTYVSFPAPETVDPDGVWRDPSAVGMAISASSDSQGRCRLEARYYILSVLLPAQRFAEAVRDHVSFREGACRVWTDHAPGGTSV